MAFRFSSSASSASSVIEESRSPASCHELPHGPATISFSTGQFPDDWALSRSGSSRADRSAVSSRSASRDSLLDTLPLRAHHSQTFRPVANSSPTLSFPGEIIHLPSGVEQSDKTAAFDVMETHSNTESRLKSRRDNLVILVYYCWSSCLLTYIAFALLSPASLYFQTATACLPDGSFNIYSDSYSPWAAEGTFQITMAYGAVSFDQAKVIDVIWDVVSLRLWTTLFSGLLFGLGHISLITCGHSICR